MSRIPSGVIPRSCQVLARQRSLRPAQLLLEPASRRLMQVEQFPAHPGFSRFLWGGELPLGQGNPALLRHNPHGFRKGNILDLAHKAENIPRYTASEAVIKLPHRVH